MPAMKKVAQNRNANLCRLLALPFTIVDAIVSCAKVTIDSVIKPYNHFIKADNDIEKEYAVTDEVENQKAACNFKQTFVGVGICLLCLPFTLPFGLIHGALTAIWCVTGNLYSNIEHGTLITYQPLFNLEIYYKAPEDTPNDEAIETKEEQSVLRPLKNQSTKTNVLIFSM